MCRLLVCSLITRHGDRVAPGPIDDGGSSQNAREVLREILRFDESLLTACRAAGVVGAFGVRAIERLRDPFAGEGRLMGPEQSPVFPLIRMTDEDVAVEWGRRRRSEVCLRGGVSTLYCGFHRAVVVRKYTRVAAVAVDVEDALPLVVRHPELDANVGVWRIFHRGDDAAKRRHVLARHFVGGCEVAGRNRLCADDR